MDTEGSSGGQEPGTEKAASLQPARWAVLWTSVSGGFATAGVERVFVRPGAEEACRAAVLELDSKRIEHNQRIILLRREVLGRWVPAAIDPADVMTEAELSQFERLCAEEGLPTHLVRIRYHAIQLPADEVVGVTAGGGTAP